MPKSRKAKAKYKDFQKVKVKFGKKLPKADNETNTSFKTRSIHVKEQGKAGISSQPTTRRKQSLNDLLAHSQHYNVSVRHEAVAGLRELFTEAPQVLHDNLAGILERVAGLCLDNEAVIRHAMHRLFKVIMPHVSSSQILPFFPVLNAHLCCAMTHIDDDIQLDSLKLVDLCLEHYPELVTGVHSSLLPNFVEQISRISNTSKTGVDRLSGSSGSRSLLVNPGSKLSSQKWRIQVLDRLHRFLRAGVEQQGHRGYHGDSKTDEVRIHVQGSTYHQPLGADRLVAGLQDSYSHVHSCKSKGSESHDVLSDRSQLKMFIEVLLPLLLECWIEAGPSQLSGSRHGNVMSVDALATLEKVLSVLQLLILSIELHVVDSDVLLMSWVREKYRRSLVQHFLPYFPYASYQPAQSHKKKMPVQQVSVVTINLMVCDIMSHFAEGLDDKEVPTWLTKLTDFIKTLTKNTSLSVDELQTLLRFTGKVMQLQVNIGVREELLSGVHRLYVASHPLSRDKQLLLTFFTNLLLTDGHNLYVRMECVVEWLRSVPQLLVELCCNQNEEVASAVLDATRQMAPHDLPSLSESLQQNCNILIDACGRLSGTLQVKMMEVLYWVPRWPKEQFVQLSSLCHRCLLEPPALSCLLQGLHYRYLRSMCREDQDVCSAGDLLSFLISVLLGKSQSQLQTCSNVPATEPCGADTVTLSSVSHEAADTWLTSMGYTKVICDMLRQFPNSHQVAIVMNSSIDKLVMEYKNLPLQSGFGLLSAVNTLHQSNVDVAPPQSITMVTLAVAIAKEAVSLEMRLAASGKSAEHVEGEVSRPQIKRDVFDLCGTVLMTSPRLPARFVTSAFTQMEGCRSIDDVYLWVSVLHLVLSNMQLRRTFATFSHKINNLMAALENEVRELGACQWWSDFKYQLSLIQPKHS